MPVSTRPHRRRRSWRAGGWMGLLEQFHGGGDGLRDSLYRMHAENAQQIEHQHSGPSPTVVEFIESANAARTEGTGGGRCVIGHCPPFRSTWRPSPDTTTVWPRVPVG
jgi:hypothetical protein